MSFTVPAAISRDEVAPLDPPIFSGPNIADQTSTVGTPWELNVAGLFTGGAVTSYSLNANAPSWMSVDNAGLISGTPDAEAISTGIIVTATNADGSADSNAWQMDAQAVTSNDAYQTEWTIPSDLFTIDFPASGPGANYDIDWGDGQQTLGVTNTTVASHEYATSGVYTISVTGIYPVGLAKWNANADKITALVNLGSVGWTSFNNMYENIATITSVTLGDFDTSTVTTSRRTFRNNTGIVGVLDATGLITSACTDVYELFYNCASITEVHCYDWDWSGVIQLNSQFASGNSLTAIKFNTLDTFTPTSLANAFSFVPNLTDCDIADIEIGSLTNCTSTFKSTPWSTAQYDKLLIAWAARPDIQPNVTFTANTTKYSAGAAATARGVLTGAPNNWTIVDAGQV